MVINEETIRNIVTEAIRNMLSEKTMLKLGKTSPQPQSTVEPSNTPMPSDMGGEDAAMPMGDAPIDNLNSTTDASPMVPPVGDNPTDGGNIEDDAPIGEPSSDGDDSTISIINQLSDTDKEAVRSYAQSMLNRDESQNGSGNVDNPPMDGSDIDNDTNAMPMAESYIFTKKQVQMIRENFGPTADELSKKDNRKPLEKKKTNKVSSVSPFNSPKFK